MSNPPTSTATAAPAIELPVDDATPVDEAIREAAALAKSGEADRAVRLLTEVNRAERSPEVERLIVKHRRRAFLDMERPEPCADWPPRVADPFPDVDGLPEVAPADLTPERVTGGVQHHGALIIRGFVTPERAASFRQSIDRAFDSYDEAMSDGQTRDWFQPFAGSIEKQAERRAWTRNYGALWAADSPPALFEVFEQLYEAGIPDLVSEHFGEPAALSVNKLTLRRVSPGADATWHQDGRFLGPEVRALNLWITFDDCGGSNLETPALDVVSGRVDDLLDPGGPGAFVDHAISAVRVEERFGDRIERPPFSAGDALLFDERFLHKSATDPRMTRNRYTVETWFFAPSSFPPKYHGLIA